MSGPRYAGADLELFARARNWKRYWTGILHPCIRGDVLEVGAGIGANTRLLRPGGEGRWVCLEPNPRLAACLSRRIERESSLRSCEVVIGKLEDLPAEDTYDTVIYADVLEHIEDDRAELDRAVSHLARGGRLAVLGPAHPGLFSPFDETVGHFRRYTVESLRAIAPRELRQVGSRYLDCAGLLPSMANRFLLRKSMPTERQILFWDRALIPISRLLDRVLGYRVGKTVLMMWQLPFESSGAGRSMREPS